MILPLNSTPPNFVLCSECGNNTFFEATLLLKVSALQSPNGQAGIQPIATFACTKCNNINADLLPKV